MFTSFLLLKTSQTCEDACLPCLAMWQQLQGKTTWTPCHCYHIWCLTAVSGPSQELRTSKARAAFRLQLKLLLLLLFLLLAVWVTEAEPSCRMGKAAGGWLKCGSLLSAGMGQWWQLGTAVGTRERTQVREAWWLLERENEIFIPAAKTLLYFGFF